MSFPPVKMLVVVAVAFFFVGNWFFPEFWGELQETGDDVSTETGVTYYMETIGIWLSQHYEWAFLVGLSFLIIPTWFVFDLPLDIRVTRFLKAFSSRCS